MSLLVYAAIFLTATVIAVPLCRKLGLGSVLGYLLAGILLGPWGLRLIQDGEGVLHIAEFGVVMLLFVIGLELQPSRLRAMRALHWVARLPAAAVGLLRLPAPRRAAAVRAARTLRAFRIARAGSERRRHRARAPTVKRVAPAPRRAARAALARSLWGSLRSRSE